MPTPPVQLSSDGTPRRKALQGPLYSELVRLVTIGKRAQTYLEIGVFQGACLAPISCSSIAVDPKMAFDRNPMGQKPSLHLYQMTSDEFFAKHSPADVFGRPIDVAFLDGLHLFEFLLRDFINTEKHCLPGSVIMMDDCLPVNIEMTERERRPALRRDRQTAGWWTGDVWKVVEILREYRPDLRIIPVDVMPTGSIMLTGLDPASTVLTNRYQEIIERYQDQEFSEGGFEDYWERNRPIPVVEGLKSLGISVQVVANGKAS